MSETTDHKPGAAEPATLEIIFTAEFDATAHSLRIAVDAAADDALGAIRKSLGREDLAEISLEDAAAPLPDKASIAEATAEGQILHVSTPGEIQVVIVYSQREAKADFRPNATIGAIIAWAISPAALNLEGEPSDYQLKLGKMILTPDQHLGSIARGEKQVELTLVFKVKPQG